MAFESKSVAVRNVQLKVQEVCVTTADVEVLSTDASDKIVQIGEELVACLSAVKSAAAGGAPSAVAAASISLVDSTTLLAGGDKKAIRLAGLTLAAGDVVRVLYRVKS